MKPRNNRFLVLASIALGADAIIGSSAQAGNKYYDTTTASGLNAGVGTWDVGTTAVWGDSTTGTSLVNYVNGSDVFFQTGGVNTVTLGGNLTANSITQSGSGTNTTINTGVGTSITLTTGNITNSGNAQLAINPNLVLGASGTFSATNVINIGGSISGGYGITKTGLLNLNTSVSNSFTGPLTVNAGAVATTLSGSAGTPFGTGSITLNGVGGSHALNGGATALSIIPSATGATSLTGGTDSGSKLSFSGTSFIYLQRKDASSPLTFTYGPGGSGSVLDRVGTGVLSIQDNGTGVPTSLGTAGGNNFLIAGGAPTLTNGMAAAYIIGSRNGGNGESTFLTYDATYGFKPLTYDVNNSLVGWGSDKTVQITTQTLASDMSAYALRIYNGALNLNGKTITIGSGTAPAGLILNSNNGGTTGGGVLDFEGREGIIHTGNGNILNASIAGSGGITKSQSSISGGILYLTGNNSYTGTTTINNGILSIGNATTTGDLGGSTLVNIRPGTAATNGAILQFSRSDAYAWTGNLTGGTSTTGGIVQQVGAGDLTLNLGNTTNFVGEVKNTSTGALVLNSSSANFSGASFLSKSGAGDLTIRISGTGSELGKVRNGNATGVMRLTADSPTAEATLTLRSALSTTVNVDSGIWNAREIGQNSSGLEQFRGALNISNATLNITNSGRYAHGNITVQNGGSFIVKNDRFHYGIEQGGDFTTQTIVIEAGGLLEVYSTGGGTSIGGFGGSGTGNSNMVLTVRQTGGIGKFGVTNGVSTSNRNLSIGGSGLTATTAQNSKAAYDLSGGKLLVAGTLQGGTIEVGATGYSNLNLRGGSLSAYNINATYLGSTDSTTDPLASSLSVGTVVNRGSTLAPGDIGTAGKTAITGNYTVNSGALAVDIGGSTAATTFQNFSAGTYDNVTVSGSTVLGGKLNVALSSGYTPPNDTSTLYKVLVGSAGGVTGTFTNQQTATSGNSRVVLADGLSSFLIGINNTASTATTGGLTSVSARTVALGGYQALNTYSGDGTAWDTASAGAWTNFDAGATATPATQASGAIAQFADGSASTGAIGVSLNSTRNLQGIQFSSAAGSRAYTISQGGSGEIILDNTGNSAAATITDTSSNGTANAINVPITLNSNLTASVTNTANTLTIGGTIGGSGQSLTKSGNGTMELTGTNTYSGGTTVSAGTLLVNNSSGSGTGSGPVTVSGGTLGGSGRISGATTIQVLGTLAPGNSPGLLTFTNTLSLAGSTVMEIDGTVRESAYDAVDLIGADPLGTLTYGGTLTLDFGTTYGIGTYSFDLFNFAAETGTFSTITLTDQYSGSLTLGAPGVWGLTSGDNTWQFTESTGVLGLTVVPEPNVAALLGGLGTLLLLRRRRR